jgi:hypothetical protein
MGVIQPGPRFTRAFPILSHSHATRFLPILFATRRVSICPWQNPSGCYAGKAHLGIWHLRGKSRPSSFFLNIPASCGDRQASPPDFSVLISLFSRNVSDLETPTVYGISVTFIQVGPPGILYIFL